MKKVLYILIGPKGAGKSYLGTQIDRRTDIHFLQVEPIWLGLQPGDVGWKMVEQTIDALFDQHDRLMIESLGAGDEFRDFLTALGKKYSVKLIRVKADLATCLQRVKHRSSAGHIPVSDEMVMEYNRIASGVTYNWDLEIDNNGPAGIYDICNAILALDRLAHQG